MKRLFLLIALLSCVALTAVYAEKDDGNEVLRRSEFYEPPNYPPVPSSFPQPFTELNNPITRPPISTGYYFVDSDDNAPDYWRPIPIIVDTTTEPNLWKRIVPGPRLLPKTFWEENPNEGLRFFRNPTRAGVGPVDFFDHAPTNSVDSTDNAIAGPIPIGFGFYFNGLRFDSFYVTTNGLIALTNRRYFYNSAGDRVVPTGSNSCYDPMSTDWFIRGRAGDGLDDPTADNFGYQYSVCGNNLNSTTAGIRGPAGSLNAFSANQRAHVIAPFMGDNHLSQWDAAISQPDDYGRVYFKRSNAADKLIIYFVNIAPVGTKATPYGNYTAQPDLRRGDNNYISANAQVVLSRTDSSVTIIYERFDGVAIVSNRAVPANIVFRYNSSAGVRGFARHVNYGQPGGQQLPWAGEYEQYTHYFSNYRTTNVNYPHNFLAVKFKQWQNSLRVVDIQYRIRKPDANAGLEYSEVVPSTKVQDYELLAGDTRNGGVQPVGIIQNLTNEIQGPQGINFIPQEFNFRTRFRILNKATERIVYSRLVPIDSTCLATPDDNLQNCIGESNVKVRYVNVTIDKGDYNATPFDFPGANGLNGIPPYGFVQVHFSPFEPNEFLDNHIGRMEAFIIGEPTNPATGDGVGDEWPFDDTTRVRLFSMRVIQNMRYDGSEFHLIDRVPMPSVIQFVNIDAEIVPGEDVSLHPLPPRREESASNNENFPIESPVIRMTRRTLQGGEPLKSPGGDELRSFPIEMRGKLDAVLSLSVQRTAHSDDWERGWSNNQLIGAEPRSVVNGDPLAVWTDYAGSAAQVPDELLVEFARSTPDGIKYITNIPDKRWQYHPRRDGADPVEDMPALTVYGAGGYMVGFLETDKDSSLSRPAPGQLNGLRPNFYDDGIDFEYKKFFVAIPDTFITAPNDAAKFFRFRVRVNATNDKKCITCIPDDDDVFFVDDIRILEYSPEATDLAITAIKINWPYTEAPASQITNIPVQYTISNNTVNDAPSFNIKVGIYRQGDPNNKWVYCRQETISNLNGQQSITDELPAWNARPWGPGNYQIQGIISVPGGDLDEVNDSTFWDFTLNVGETFAYDPVQQPRNDVPDAQFSGIPGAGLRTFGFAYGGNGYNRGPRETYNELVFGSGYIGGNGSGQIATKFVLRSTDTIFGYNAFYGLLNQAPDDIALSIYTDVGGRQPGEIVPGSLIYRQRGLDDIRDELFFDEYVTHLADNPVILPSGTWWMVIAQLGETGLELAASKSRMGMRTTNIFIPPPITVGGPTGGGGFHLMIEKTFRMFANNNLINNNFFALENTRGNGTWLEFMPSVGNPAYAHLHHYGISPVDGYTATLSRGSWIPMIRPYLGERSLTEAELLDCGLIFPVELAYFVGDVRSNGIDLNWETASEINNAGFYVERRVQQTDNDYSEWESVDFIKGAGNTTSANTYNYFDGSVLANHTYQYRLRQVDYDGTHNCHDSRIVTLTYTGNASITLENNRPNPFKEYTLITVKSSVSENIKLEIIDVYGNVVKSLHDGTVSSESDFKWDGTDNYGSQLANGTYICRMIAGDDIQTCKMTLVR